MPRPSPSPARSPNAPALTACARCGPTPRARSGRTSPSSPATLRRPAPPAAAAAPETVDGAPDWRALLDLLEERTGVSYDDLWRKWVARDTDLPLLDARRAARTEYDKVVEAAGDWLLPRALRDAMRAWRFDQATTMLDDATTVLDDRAQIATDAAAAGLTVPDTLRTAFESPDGFASAAVEATAELAAIHGYTSAVEARRTAADTIEALGLWGLNPEGDLARARTLFASGDVGRIGRGGRCGRVGLDGRRRGGSGAG